MDKAAILDEISKLETTIDGYEDTDPAYLSQPIRELRHRIFYVHFRVERSLEILIMRAINGTQIGKAVDEEMHKQISNAWLVMDELSFYKKLRLVKKMKLLDAESKLDSLIEKVNTLRNEFAHPEEFGLRKYQDDKELKLKTLLVLSDAMKGLNSVFSKFS